MQKKNKAESLLKTLRLKKLEPIIFVVLTVLNLFPVIFTKFVPTLDGASHLYNSKLINHLLFDAHSHINDFFVFNPEPVPNYFGHILLCFFNLFFPSWLAEKSLIVLYLLAFPLSFRNLIKTISPKNLLLSYLVFPFTYTLLFFYAGFYNNSFAIIFMLLALNYWIRFEDDLILFQNNLYPTKGHWKKWLFFMLLLLLTYFSHLFIFGILLMIICIQILIKSVMNVKALPVLIRKSITLIVFSIVPLILLFLYFYSRKSTGEVNYMSFSEQLYWLKNLELTYDEDKTFVGILFYSWIVIIIYAIVFRFNLARHSWQSRPVGKLISSIKSVIIISDVWLMSSILLLIFYFTFPDGDGVAGYVTLRFGLLFFIIVSIWIATQSLPRRLSLVVIFVMLAGHFKLNFDRMNTVKSLNTIAVDINNLSQQIEPNSIVLTLNYSDNPRLIHYSNYLGIDKPIVILENYECNRGWFPLLWNLKSMPITMLGDINSDQPCIYTHGKGTDSTVKIDYVFVLGNMESKTDSCTQMIKKNVLEYYDLLPRNSDKMKLYRLKNKFSLSNI